MSISVLRTYRGSLAVLAAAVLAVGVYAGIAQGGGPTSPSQGRGPETYASGLFGDMPYNARGKAEYPNLPADINASEVSFSSG